MFVRTFTGLIQIKTPDLLQVWTWIWPSWRKLLRTNVAEGLHALILSPEKKKYKIRFGSVGRFSSLIVTALMSNFIKIIFNLYRHKLKTSNFTFSLKFFAFKWNLETFCLEKNFLSDRTSTKSIHLEEREKKSPGCPTNPLGCCGAALPWQRATVASAADKQLFGRAGTETTGGDSFGKRKKQKNK